MKNKHLPYLLILWILPSIVYFLTRQPSLYFIDAGTTVAAASSLGIPTPPGYPSYTMLAHLFTKLPFGDVLLRIQIFSILISLSTLTLVYFFINKLFAIVKPLNSPEGFVRLIATVSALFLSFSAIFWSQTLNAQAYIFTDLLLLTIVFLLISLKNPSKITKTALISGVLLAIAAGGSTVMVFMIVPILIVTAVFYWNQVGVVKGAMLSLAAIICLILIYSYLPIRSMQRPFLNWGNPQTVELFFAHVQGMGLSFNDPITGKVTGFTGSFNSFIKASGRYFYLLFVQFTWVALPFIGFGYYYLYKKNRHLFFSLLSIPVMNLIFGGLWLSGNQEAWFIISYIVFAIVMGVGMGFVTQLLSRFKVKVFDIGLVLALLSLSPLIWWYGKMNHSKSYVMSDYAENLYANLPKDAVLIGIYDTFQAATLDKRIVSKDRPDVFPVMTNMLYVLPWYREHLRHFAPDLVPTEIDSITTFNRVEEYNEMLNFYIEYLLKKERQVYVAYPVFSKSVLVGSNEGVFKPDPKKLKAIPAGLTSKIVLAEGSTYEPKEEEFNFKFKNIKEYKKPHFYIEKGYVSSYNDVISEYVESLIVYAEYLLEDPATGPLRSEASWSSSGRKEQENPTKSQTAEKMLMLASQIAGDSTESLNRLAIAYATQGKFTKTVELFEKLNKLFPKDINIQFNLAKAFFDSGQEQKAKEMFSKIGKDNSQIQQAVSSQLSMIESFNQNLKNYQPFENDQMNLKFYYPEDYAITFAGDNMIKITNNAKGKDELTMLIYSKKLADGQFLVDLSKNLPFVIDGISLGSQPTQMPGFQAKVKTYATGETSVLLFLLRHNDQAFAVRVFPGDSNKAEHFQNILQSIRVLK